MCSIYTVMDVEFKMFENSYFCLCLGFTTGRDFCIRITSEVIRVLVIFSNVLGKDVM
jgi:hypothetical protein